MREIEFRGKRKDNGEWVYGYLIVDEISDKYYIFSKGNSCNETDRIGEEGLLHILTFEVIPETVGQYTRLKDKKGKKIFEGDIVKDQYCIYEVVYDGNGYYIQVVKLLKECGTAKGLLYDLSDYKDLEIIGNIYDNPELLEEEL